MLITCHASASTLQRIPPRLLSQIVEHLSEEELLNLSTAIEDIPPFSILFKITKTKLIFRAYLNRADRSFYFSLFDSPTFIEYENKQMAEIALQDHYQLFS
jgi:hypothetical protein